MKKLLSLRRRPNAVIAFNDYVAMDAIRYARRQKIRINKDVSFVNFANEAICDYMNHPVGHY
ncbi:MAG: substrate-binding domain-containing protein [Bacteroidetes bacterium]|nr:substrate-binding domain-containing protein [Bacteroidota bacterium]MBS1609881.1 substrate-binding domain-containing protein [Bacteroidota bacterium]